jgi:FMN phosphatase YigB (HAD superfamily)
MRPEVVLLDCGGTLSWPPFDRLDQILSDLKGRTIGREAHYRAFSRGTHALDDYLRVHHGQYPTHDSFTLNHWVYAEGITREGYPGLWTRDCTEEVLFRDGRLGKWDHTFPWVQQSLQRLKAAGYRLAVVSNSDGHVVALLKALGYAPFFETIVDSFHERVWKPDPAIFYLGLARMGLSRYARQAEQAVQGRAEPPPVMYVGDNWRSDYEGAVGAGLMIRLVDPLGLFSQWTPHRVRDMIDLADELCSRNADTAAPGA